MQTLFGPGTRSALLATAALAALALCGCDKRGPNELVTTPNAVYRINRDSGEVSLIAGTEIVKLREQNDLHSSTATNHVVNWLQTTNAKLGNVTLKLKTNWREGRLFYIFEIAPYSERIKDERQNPASPAKFYLHFSDSDGFEILDIPVSISPNGPWFYRRPKPAIAPFKYQSSLYF